MADVVTPAALYTVKSYAKGVDIAPRKVSVVASLVRNRTVADALVILDHVPRRAGVPIKKAIASAQSNAVNNHGLDASTLQITTLSVTVGKRLKRFKPHMRGMALPFQKISTNILVEVTGIEKPARPARQAEPKKKPVAKKATVKKEEEA